MKKILTVTLNPVVDRRYGLQKIRFGQPNRVFDVTVSAGGKGVNIAKVLKTLGADVLATGVAGGATGAFLTNELKKSGIETQFLSVAGATRTGVNIFDGETGVQTEFLEPGGGVTDGEAAAFLRLFERLLDGVESVVIAGSCAPGFHEDIYARLIRLAKARGVKTFLDAEGELLLNGARELPYFLKPNEHEIAALYGGGEFEIKKAVETAAEYVRRGVKYFVVSLGENGAIMASDSGVFRAVPEKIHAVNTAGSGDAAVAGFVFADAMNYADKEKLRLFSRCGALNALQNETGKIDPEKIESVRVDVTPF